MKRLFIFLAAVASVHALTFHEFVFMAGKHLNKTVVMPSDFDPRLEIDLSHKSQNYDLVLRQLSEIYGFNLTISAHEIYISIHQEQNISAPATSDYGNGINWGVKVGDTVTPARLFDYNTSIPPKSYLHHVYQLRYLNKDDVDRLMGLSSFGYRYIENINAVVIRYEAENDCSLPLHPIHPKPHTSC